MLKYRPDIDGLRALAVLPVVLFHADIPGFSGGFVGVDIFFVISGFLITSLLLTELQDNQFSLRRFYIRRARRLFPALLVMVAVTLLAGFFLLIPEVLAETSKAARRIAVFFSNHLFWAQTNDYWLQNTLSDQPLLHTWSLAVEEQFYLIMPGLLLCCFWLGKKQGKRFSLVLLSGLFVISLLGSQYLLGKDPSAAFYLLPSRAWELLSGALLVFIVQRKQPIRLHPLALQLTGTSGLVLIGYSVFFYDKETAFPGFSALLPCLGAVLIIYAGSQSNMSWINQLLKNRLLVFIGLISYSLYLWHWPLLVLYRSPNWLTYNLPDIPVWLLLGFTFCMAWVSWRWIEQPFRKQASKQASKSLSEWRQLGMGLMALIFCWGLGTVASKRMAGQLQPVPDIFKESIGEAAGKRCERDGKDPSLIKSGATNCTLGDTNTAPAFFVLGDSHARAWTTGLDALAKEYKTQGVALSYPHCTPVFEFIPRSKTHCPDIINAAIDYITENSAENIILLGYWSSAVERLNHDNTADGLPIFYTKLSQVLEKLTAAEKNIYFVYDVPQLEDKKMPISKLVESLSHPQKNAYVSIPSAQQLERQQFAEGIEHLQKKYHFMTIDPTPNMLDAAGNLLLIEQAHSIYSDDNHLTDYGSLRFREVFLPLFEDIRAKQAAATPPNPQPAALH